MWTGRTYHKCSRTYRKVMGSITCQMVQRLGCLNMEVAKRFLPIGRAIDFNRAERAACYWSKVTTNLLSPTIAYRKIARRSFFCVSRVSQRLLLANHLHRQASHGVQREMRRTANQGTTQKIGRALTERFHTGLSVHSFRCRGEHFAA